ncbi:MAG: GtrA family protein [Clostridiales bacterium]|jgi:putative flippase GtrA|nr:GtrA family protein [Clostridiales bacterium]
MKIKKDDIKPLFFEFMRFCIVGGTAFIADFGVLVLLNNLLPELSGLRLYLATAGGFIVGLTVNYILSIRFVFINARKFRVGRSFKDFVIFTLVSAVGFGMTELGMYVGTELLSVNYMVVKIVVTGIVMIWNYLGRKILIFK